MNVSRRWLEEFLRRPLDARDVAARLAMLGAPVDAIEPLHAGLDEIRVAYVSDVRPHPNADRLRLCSVDAGTGAMLNVVCGAANVTAGRKYPFAPVGATIPGRPPKKPSLTLERRKIRGEYSEGMLCSLEELGFEPDGDGIWELDTDAAPGTPLAKALTLGDDRLVVDVTANRPDLLGHKGIARELAASFGVPFRLPAIAGTESLDVLPARRYASSGDAGGVHVAIEDPDGCGRFHAVCIRGVRVGPSPTWLRRRLESAGVRAINNVVDATNYVMLELNQPMHAYDAAKLRGPAVIARRAKAGERLTTLDGVERELTSEMTAIADAAGVIGVAGVMGGSATEVDDATSDVLLECAWFDPTRIRRTRRALGLSTDASYRFERGVDKWGAAEPFRRGIELVLALGGGEIVGEPLDLWPRVDHPPRIFLRLSRLAQVLGVSLPLHTVERHLVAIGATIVSKPEDERIAVDVPGWRPDLTAEIDLVEEVARLHGYDAFPEELGPFRVGDAPDAPMVAVSERARRALIGLGLLEAQTLPMGADSDGSVRILNPVSVDTAVMRPRLLPGLVRQAELNWSLRERDVRLFEIGTVFDRGAPDALPMERQHAAVVVSGAREPGHWTGAAPDLDLWDLRGLFESALHSLWPGASLEPEGEGWAARIGGRVIGRGGVIQADSPPWAAPVLGFELELVESVPDHTRFTERPVTPASDRDVTLLVPDGIPAAELLAALSGAGVSVLESVRVVNEFRGPRIPSGMRSLTLRATFRAPGRTLETADVDRAEEQLLGAVERETGVRRRDQGDPATE